MAYLELSKEAYDDLLHAAGSRAGQVAKVCNELGVWETTVEEEAAQVADNFTEVQARTADQVSVKPPPKKRKKATND